MTTLAHAGPAALRDRYELVYRRRAEHPNAMWQADHTELDILILNEHGAPVRPWLSIVLDDHSRAVAGCIAFVGAPSALNTSLTLRPRGKAARRSARKLGLTPRRPGIRGFPVSSDRD